MYFVDKSRRAVKRHFTAHFDRDNAAVRQLTLRNMYRKLLELSEVGGFSLNQAMVLW